MVTGLLHRKEYLILTTIEIIDELGIQGLTTREIAKRQNVSEATIFRHFKNKNELLLSVLDYYIQFDLEVMQSAIMAELKPIEAIKYIIMKNVEYYENYPALTAITQLYDVFRYDKELEVKVKEIKQSRKELLTQLVDEAQKLGEIRQDVESELISFMIFGLLREICLDWRMDDYKSSFHEKIGASLDLFLDSIKVR